MLVAHLIRDYFDQYRMDYSKSVYIPEVALDKAADLRQSQSREHLMRRLPQLSEQGDPQESVLVQMVRQLRNQQA